MLVFQRLAISPESVDPEAGDEVFSLYEHNLAVHPLQSKTQGNRSGKTPDLDSLSAVCTVYISIYQYILESFIHVPFEQTEKADIADKSSKNQLLIPSSRSISQATGIPFCWTTTWIQQVSGREVSRAGIPGLVGHAQFGIQQESVFNGPWFWH